jgi:HAMP domain-containing protein
MTIAAIIVVAIVAACSVLIATCASIILIQLERENKELEKLRKNGDSGQRLPPVRG